MINKKMDDKEIEKIAQAIAAKLAEPPGNRLLGCGSASNSTGHFCSGNYSCSTYECGGAGLFGCIGSSYRCTGVFKCYDGFYCSGIYSCSGSYNP